MFYVEFMQYPEWWIKDFPNRGEGGGANLKGGGTNLLIGQIFPESCMKMKCSWRPPWIPTVSTYLLMPWQEKELSEAQGNGNCVLRVSSHQVRTIAKVLEVSAKQLSTESIARIIDAWN